MEIPILRHIPLNQNMSCADNIRDLTRERRCLSRWITVLYCFGYLLSVCGNRHTYSASTTTWGKVRCVRAHTHTCCCWADVYQVKERCKRCSWENLRASPNLCRSRIISFLTCTSSCSLKCRARKRSTSTRTPSRTHSFFWIPEYTFVWEGEIDKEMLVVRSLWLMQRVLLCRVVVF